MKYLIFIVIIKKIEMDPEKVITVLNQILFFGLKDLQKFLSFANFYKRFIKNYSKLYALFYDFFKRENFWN